MSTKSNIIPTTQLQINSTHSFNCKLCFMWDVANSVLDTMWNGASKGKLRV